jgi:hypothetical protein
MYRIDRQPAAVGNVLCGQIVEDHVVVDGLANHIFLTFCPCVIYDGGFLLFLLIKS